MVTEIQRFLGTANYYRCYIANIAQIAEPLYALIRRESKWIWSEKCEEAFQGLRSTLSRDPVVSAFPDWNKPFHIETDVAEQGYKLSLANKTKPLGK